MKELYTIAAVLFISVFLLPVNGQSRDQEELQIQKSHSILSDTIVFTVYGMDCPGCEGGLEKQVNKIPSVRFSDANWVKQELKIVLAKDSVIDMTVLEKRVKKANFTLETKKKNSE